MTVDNSIISGGDGWGFSRTGRSEVVVVPGDFPNDATTPDHRPVKATLTIIDPKQQILNRITALEAELAALKVLVGQM